MHFVESLEISNKNHFSKNDLWLALLQRVYNPIIFQENIVTCRIVNESELGITRELDFSTHIIRDFVSFEGTDAIRFEIEKNNFTEAASLLIQIMQNPAAAGQFALQFSYHTTLGKNPDTEVDVEGFLRQAYHAADRDTITTIELLLEHQLTGKIQ